jgi:hypothetical protein
MDDLQKQMIEIPFGSGVDTQSDSKIIKPPKLAALENVRLVNGETINKRYGTVGSVSGAQPPTAGSYPLAKVLRSASGSIIGVTQRQPAFGGDETFLLPNGASLISGVSGWASPQLKPSFVSDTSTVRFHQSCLPTVKDVVRNQYQQTVADGVVAFGAYSHYAYEENGGINYALIARSNGMAIGTGQVSSAATRPRLLVLNSVVVLGYWDTATSNLHLRVSQAGQGGLTSAQTLIACPTGLWDWTGVPGTNDFILVNQFTGSKVAINYFTNPFGVSLSHQLLIAENPDNAIAVATMQSATDPVRVFWHNNANGLRAAVSNTAVTALTTAAYTLDASVAPVVQNITAINGPSQNTKFWMLAEVNNATTYNTSIKCFMYATDGVATPGSSLIRSLGLASKLVMRDSGLPSFMAAYDSSLQATYFLFDIANPNGDATKGMPEVRAKVLGGIAGGLTKRAMLPNLTYADSKTLMAAGARKEQVISTGGKLTTLLGVADLSFQFSATIDDWANKATPAYMNNLLLMTGGMLGAYDGQFPLEQGFLVYPETPTATPAAAGGLLADGTYTYSVTYEYVDFQGNVVESTPAVSGTATVSGGGGAGKITFTVPTYRIGLGLIAPGGGATTPLYRKCSVVVWLSDANLPNVLYRATDPVSLTINDATVDSLSIAITTVSNATLIGRQTLYTTGNVLPNFTPDGPSCMTTYGKNLIIDDPNDPTILRYSKLDTSRYGPHFAAAFTIPVFGDGGRPIAVIPMDGRLIIFKAQQIWTCYGTGLDDLGNGQGFSTPQRLRDDIGCVGPQLLCEIPQGILFSSSKGIWLLGRDLSVTYAGAAVDAYNSATIRSFTHVRKASEVRILLNDGVTTLVYSYYWTDEQGVGQWWTNTNYSGNSATVDGNGVYTFAHLTAGLSSPYFQYAYQENSSGFTDNHIANTPGIVAKITTPWFRFADIQRVWEVFLLGESKSSHSLLIEVAYNFETSFSETHTITSANATSGNGVYMPWFMPKRSRCEAMRLRISDPGATGESFTLSKIKFKVGLLPGTAPQSSIKTA